MSFVRRREDDHLEGERKSVRKRWIVWDRKFFNDLWIQMIRPQRVCTVSGEREREREREGKE